MLKTESDEIQQDIEKQKQIEDETRRQLIEEEKQKLREEKQNKQNGTNAHQKLHNLLERYTYF